MTCIQQLRWFCQVFYELKKTMDEAEISRQSLDWTTLRIQGSNQTNKPVLAYIAGLVSSSGGNIIRTVHNTCPVVHLIAPGTVDLTKILAANYGNRSKNVRSIEMIEIVWSVDLFEDKMWCRFTLTLDPRRVAGETWAGPLLKMYQPHYNIAPRNLFLWSGSKAGLSNSSSGDWSHFGQRQGKPYDRVPGLRLTEKPSFRNLIKKRCLILGRRFFWGPHWVLPTKIPYYFQLENGEPFTFAGLYDEWRPDPENKIFSCTIITCTPNELISKYHDRMPVIMPIQHRWIWILRFHFQPCCQCFHVSSFPDVSQTCFKVDKLTVKWFSRSAWSITP